MRSLIKLPVFQKAGRLSMNHLDFTQSFVMASDMHWSEIINTLPDLILSKHKKYIATNSSLAFTINMQPIQGKF